MWTPTERRIIEAGAGAWRPEDKSSASEWGRRHVKVPGSARASSFDPDATPWLIEPMNLIPDDANKEIVIMMPTGAGKTTIFDVLVPRAIAESGGSIILTQQTQKEADDYWTGRLEPTLLGIDRIARQIRNLSRDKKKKGAITLPGQTLYCVPANVTEAQRKSVRWVFIDEAWQIVPHGLIEQFRARTHDRWNQRVVIVSQGGVSHVLDKNAMVPSELADAWDRTDKREYSMVCPYCKTVTTWSNRLMIFEDNPDATLESLDESAVEQSARYRCGNSECKDGIFEDKIDVRRALSQSSIYVPTNPKATARHVGFHTTAHALHFISWGQLAVQWKKASILAKLGDDEARKIYIQKRLAENWKATSDAPQIVLKASDYSLTEFENGEQWEGETYRVMTIDRQRGAKGDIPHFWVRIRAYRNDGASRGVFFGRIDTAEKVREKQKLFKVRDKLTFEDAQWDPDGTYDDCAKYGWVAVHGTQHFSFEHHEPGKPTIHRLYSPIKKTEGTIERGQVLYILLATDRVKDVLASLIAGRGAPFEHAADEPPEYEVHMRGETKKLVFDKKRKTYVLRWEKLNSRTQNHGWDLEATQVAVALLLGLIQGWESSKVEEPTAAAIDTPAES